MSSRSKKRRFKAVGRRIPVAVVLVFSLLISVLAVIHQGVTTTEVDVDDGGLWVTNASKKLVGHMNYDSRTLDAGFRAETTEFDIGQTGDTVTLADSSMNSVAPIDVAQVSLGAATSLPEGSQVRQGGQRVGILDAMEGNLWTTPAANPSSVTYTEETAMATDVDAGVVTTAVDGTVFAVSPASGLLTTAYMDGALEKVKTTKVDAISHDSKVSITAVGDEAVIYDATQHLLVMPNGSTRDLSKDGISTEITLQEPGPEADTVALATPATLVLIPLDGGDADILPANDTATDGTPAPPMRHRSCTYAAWGKSGSYMRNCDNEGDSDQMQVDSLREATQVRFRTNRTRIVLNDIRAGMVWLPEEKMVLMDDWDKIEQDIIDRENPDPSPEVTEEISDPEQREQNTPPDAQDDTFGVRPGRTTTLPVLINDNDQDGDVLTARAVTEPSFGEVTRTRGGRALQVKGLTEDAEGTTTFVYEASDGRAVDTANVTVEVHPWSVNGAPERIRDARLKLGANATIEYNMISDWIDPDGDPFYLAGVVAPAGLDVQYREEGTLVIRDLGATPGEHSIVLRVSDGTEVGEDVLTVLVQAPGNVSPVANADFVVARTGETLTIEPLANDSDPNGDNLSLVAVSVAPTGTVITPDLELSTVNFTANAPGSYQFTYTVTDGPATSMGMIRVDVVDVDEAAVPVAEDDLVVLPAGGSALAAPLNNDTDPSGGVLVVQSFQVEENSGLEVTLVDRHLLRITAPAGLESAGTIRYWVSNGSHTAEAQVTVVPTAALDAEQPPVLQPDVAKVRVGDVASVDVLANDRSPAGLALKVDTTLEYEPKPEVGMPFVTGNDVRLEAGDTPGTIHVAYTVRDSAGNLATSTVTFQVVPLQETNASPQPKALTAWAVQGETARIPVPLNGIDPDGDSVNLVGIEQSPTKGAVVLGVDWLEYTPAKGSTGTDVFTYIVEDRLGKQATARVRVGIAAPGQFNQAPVAVPDTVLARPDRRLSVTVLANDIDADGDPIVLKEGLEPADSPLGAKVNGSTVVMTTPAEPGSYILSYMIEDGRGGSGRGTLTVNVSPDAVLQPPSARDDVVSVSDLNPDGSPVTVSVLDNDDDPDGDASQLVVSTNAKDVTVRDNKLVITPEPTRRLIVYTVTDPDGLQASAVVSVAGLDRTNPVIDETRVPVEVRAGEEVTLDITDYVLVRTGRTPRIVNADTLRSSAGVEPSIHLVDEKRISFKVTPDWSGKSSVSFEARDGTADDDSALAAVLTIPLEVKSTKNLPPTLAPTPIEVAPGEEAVVSNLSLMVSDPDGADPATFTYAMSKAPEGVSVTLDGYMLSTKAGVDRAKGPVGSVTISVDDGSGAVETQIPITVVASTRPLIQTSDAVFDAAQAGGSQTIDLARYTINPFPETPIRIMDATVQVGEGTASPQGTSLTITPAPTYRGEMTVIYRLMDATGDPDRIVQGRVRLAVKDRPDAPGVPTVTKNGIGSAIVTFQPGSDNGAAITGFTLTESPDGKTFECTVASCQVSGLSNGEKHSFTVVAHNQMGSSDPSPASVPLLIDEAPLPPTGVTATAGDGQITVNWTASVTEGSAVTKYVVSVQGGSAHVDPVEVPGTATSATVSGLKNGTPYIVSVEAHNRSETPSGQSATATATPFGKPAAPTWGQVEQLGGSGTTSTVRLHWTNPDPNGPPLDLVTLTVDGTTHQLEASGGAVPQSLDVTVTAGASVEASISVRNGGGETSDVVTTTFKALGSPLDLTGTPTLRATGQHGQLEVSGVNKRPGNGFSEGDLYLQYSLDKATWNNLDGTTINVATNQETTVYFRQASSSGAQTSAGGSISAIGTPTGQVGPVTGSVTAGDSKVTFRWRVDLHSYDQLKDVKVEYSVAGGATQSATYTTTDGFIDIPASPGQVVRVRAVASNATTTSVSNWVEHYPHGTYRMTGLADCDGSSCALAVTSEHWYNGVTHLSCTVSGVPIEPGIASFSMLVNSQYVVPKETLALPMGFNIAQLTLRCGP